MIIKIMEGSGLAADVDLELKMKILIVMKMLRKLKNLMMGF